MIDQGEVWWADSGAPKGAGPRYRRPVVVGQCDDLSRSPCGAFICLPLTSNLRWADASGNARLLPRVTGLPQDSAANVSQIVAIDKSSLADRVGKLELLLAGVYIILGRSSLLVQQMTSPA